MRMMANGGSSGGGGGGGGGHQVITALTATSSSSNNTSSATVPPGFRFHPTDEELLYYYLRKKVSYEAIDLDVIREVDLNKLEPWDLKDKCRIGSGPQNDWYFFSHKDKKYPTGTRTNRATAAGFWKATGRDKPIHHHSSSSNSSRRIGMRKTLVFYIGRAPHGRKTDWIMHEYRLDDQDYSLNNIHHHHHHELEDGWVVCRVFKKKNNTTTTCRGFQQPDEDRQAVDINDQEENFTGMMMKQQENPKQNPQHLFGYQVHGSPNTITAMNMQMHLPQLLCPESMSSAALQHHQLPPPSSSSSSSFLPGGGGGNMPDDLHYYCNSQNLLSLTSGSSAGNSGGIFGRVQQDDKLMSGGDWSFLDKLLASHQNLEEQTKCHSSLAQQAAHDLVHSTQRFPLIPFQFSEPAGSFKFAK